MKVTHQGLKKSVPLLLTIAVSVALFLFFDGRKIWLSLVQPQLTAMLNSQATAPSLPAEKQQHKPTIKAAINKQNRQVTDHHITLRQFGTCQQTAAGIKYREENGIYTWIDEGGVKNYSDRKPNTRATKYHSMRNRPLDFFALDITGKNITTQFKNKLRSKLNAVFRGYTTIVGLDAMQKVTLNIKVLPNRRAYEREVQSYGGDPQGNVGLYLGRNNLALVEQRSTAATMRTAVHEAVHAINQAVIGFSPRWLNEGLAEYFEVVTVNMQVGTIKPIFSRVQNGFLKKHVLSPFELIAAEPSWVQNNIGLMYRSSWAMIYFLMSSKEGKQSLKNLMLQEQSERCSSLSDAEAKVLLLQNYPDITERFVNFVQSPIKNHRL